MAPGSSGADLSFHQPAGASLRAPICAAPPCLGTTLRDADLSGALLDPRPSPAATGRAPRASFRPSRRYAECGSNAGVDAAQRGRFSPGGAVVQRRRIGRHPKRRSAGWPGASPQVSKATRWQHPPADDFTVARALYDRRAARNQRAVAAGGAQAADHTQSRCRAAIDWGPSLLGGHGGTPCNPGPPW